MSTRARLGVTVIPGAGWRASDIQIAREAEAAGFDAIFTTEVNNDALATAQLMGSANRIEIGAWIASIYLRHSYTCAKGASLIADDTGGRFVLGLGVSHQPVNDALGIDMSNAPADLHRYAIEVRTWLDGNEQATHLPQQRAPVAVPSASRRSAWRPSSEPHKSPTASCRPCGPRTSHPKRRPGRSGPRPGARTCQHWTSRWDCRHSSGTTRLSAVAPARTWGSTPLPLLPAHVARKRLRRRGRPDEQRRRTGRTERSPAGLLFLFGPVTSCQQQFAQLYRTAGVGLPHPQSAHRTRRRARCDPRIRDVGHRRGAADPDTHVTCVREQESHPPPAHYEPVPVRCTYPWLREAGCGNIGCIVDDAARDRAIYHALKAADEVAAALQAHLIEEHSADLDRAAAQSPATDSLKLLRQARERFG